MSTTRTSRPLRAGQVTTQVTAGLVVLIGLLCGRPALAGESGGKPGTAPAKPAAAVVTPAPLYLLPWPAGVSHPCYQGNFGKATHLNNGQQNNYAWDFGMEPGDPIAAARAGRVVSVNDKGGPAGDRENTIRVLHEDQTYGVYAHLRTGSAKVKTGDEVEAGELLAASGDMMHLHFVVWDVRTMQSIPAAFLDVKGDLGVPQEKRSYRSGAPQVTAETIKGAAGVLARAEAERAKGRGPLALRMFRAVAEQPGGGGAQRRRAREAAAELTAAALQRVDQAAAQAAAGDRTGARRTLDLLAGDFRGTDVERAARRTLGEIAKSR